MRVVDLRFGVMMLIRLSANIEEIGGRGSGREPSHLDPFSLK